MVLDRLWDSLNSHPGERLFISCLLLAFPDSLPSLLQPTDRPSTPSLMVFKCTVSFGIHACCLFCLESKSFSSTSTLLSRLVLFLQSSAHSCESHPSVYPFLCYCHRNSYVARMHIHTLLINFIIYIHEAEKVFSLQLLRLPSVILKPMPELHCSSSMICIYGGK